MDRSLIEKYAAGAPLLAKSIAGLSRDDFLATPVPNTWSIAQITLHLMDSDLIASDRMKRVIAEENPAIIGYNETALRSIHHPARVTYRESPWRSEVAAPIVHE